MGVAGWLHKVLDKCVMGDEFETDCDIANYKDDIAGIVSRGDLVHDRTRLIADIDSYEYAVVELVGQVIWAYVQDASDCVQYWYSGLYHYWWWDLEYGKDWPDVRTVVRVDALWGLRVWVGGKHVDVVDVLNCPTGCADLMEWVRRELGYE